MKSQLSTSEFLRVREHTLGNGLTVWLNEDHSQPKIFGAIVVNAGAKDSPNTGIAHYFEHMMFKGTDKIGTIDYEAEKVLLDRIAEKYDALADTDDPATRAHLQQIINDLSVRAAEYVIPNEFDRLITRYGGTRLNAGTSYDYTLYFNTFSPQYIQQWAEINSERLINPVFRLFQSELETVYEEKNMYGDAMASAAIEKLTERYFYPHPYAYPIIGSAENLKNPRLSEMRKFFEKYYVASNMGLILSGDFDAETTLPILDAAFSRLRGGEPPRREVVPLPPFQGREAVTVRVPIPFVKLMALGFRGVPATHPDQVPLSIAMSLLNNANGTGLLDKLTVEHKVLGAMAINESMNEAGILGLLVFPKMILQTCAAAEKLVWKQINRVKEGDFSDEMFQSLKLERAREYMTKLEDINSRAEAMMRVFSQGRSWRAYLDEVVRIESLTKEEVVEVARRYFTENYLYVTKKTGRYPKTLLPKPPYAPVVPKNADVSSAYVRKLEKMPVQVTPPHFLDFGKDAEVVPLRPLVTLYKVHNPVNEVFSLVLSYGIGELEARELEKLSAYLPLIATESMTFDVFRGRLQALGSVLTFESTDAEFRVIVNGFDARLAETLELVGDFLRHAKPDDKKLKQIVDEAKVMEKSLFKSSENVADMLLEKVKFADRSRYLTKLSLAEVKKLRGKRLVELFRATRAVECDVHYYGTLPTDEVVRQIDRHLPLDETSVPSNSPYLRPLMAYDKPTVFFLDMKEVAQSIVYGYMYMDPLLTLPERYAARVFNGYFGGDMSSLMFQEIREFRSFAYQVSARLLSPPLCRLDSPSCFVTRLATQADKVADAMEVLEGLIREMPERPERLEAVKRTIRNWVNNEYPTNRLVSMKIASLRRDGYACDPNRDYLAAVEAMTMEDIRRFYTEHIKERTIAYAIVGSAKRIDMERLARFGQIVKITRKDIYK